MQEYCDNWSVLSRTYPLITNNIDWSTWTNRKLHKVWKNDVAVGYRANNSFMLLENWDFHRKKIVLKWGWGIKREKYYKAAHSGLEKNYIQVRKYIFASGNKGSIKQNVEKDRAKYKLHNSYNPEFSNSRVWNFGEMALWVYKLSICFIGLSEGSWNVTPIAIGVLHVQMSTPKNAVKWPSWSGHDLYRADHPKLSRGLYLPRNDEPRSSDHLVSTSIISILLRTKELCLIPTYHVIFIYATWSVIRGPAII